MKNFINKFTILAIFAILLAARAAMAAQDSQITRGGPDYSTELWTGKVITATFRAGMCFHKDGKARGVLLLRHYNGNEDVYHLYGTIKNNKFHLTHGSGHVLDGEITSPHAIKAKVKLGNGMRLSLDGERFVNAPLVASDCAPPR